MRTELLEAVAQVITAHSWWVRVVGTTEYHPYAMLRDEHLQYTTCRCITLEATRSRGIHYVGSRWQIAEIDLDEVLADMLGEVLGLRERCKSLAPSPEDVETLIMRASHGMVKLDMLDDDFVPQVYRH